MASYPAFTTNQTPNAPSNGRKTDASSELLSSLKPKRPAFTPNQTHYAAEVAGLTAAVSLEEVVAGAIFMI